MSLTSFLQNKDNEDCIKFQEEIKKITPSKKDFSALNSDYTAFETKRELLVPYNLSIKNEGALIGVEFDYLARFRIAQIVERNRNEAIENIVADNFFDTFRGDLPKGIFNKLHKKYFRIKEKIKRYIISKVLIDDKLIDDIFFISILEQCWRSKRLPRDINALFNKPSDEFRKEIKEMLRTFEYNFIHKIVRTSSTVKYNPKFGDCSYTIGGADADIYIDGTLYDFKCSKNIGYRAKDAQQIMGYYILNDIAKRRDTSQIDYSLENLEIRTVAIYSVRVGEIYYFNVRNVEENLKDVSLKIEEILFRKEKIRLKKVEKGFEKRGSKNNKKYQLGSIKSVIIAFMAGIVVFSGVTYFSSKNNTRDIISSKSEEQVNNDSEKTEDKNEAINKSKEISNSSVKNNIMEEKKEEKTSSQKAVKKENDKEKLTINNEIVLHYDDVYEKASDVLPRAHGFYRYYSILTSTLRSYNISNVNDAFTVYKLSDQLLNNMYKFFKINYGEEAFEELKAEQLIWIDNKMKLEKKLENNQLKKYEALIDMTLNKCEEWTDKFK